MAGLYPVTAQPALAKALEPQDLTFPQGSLLPQYDPASAHWNPLQRHLPAQETALVCSPDCRLPPDDETPCGA